MLQDYSNLTVRQEVEMLQVFTGFETRNRYRVLDPSGQDVLYAYEESGTLSRLFLNAHRPLTLHIIDGNGQPVLTAKREFFWFFSHLHFSSPEGREMGSMQRRFKWINRRFDLTDAEGSLLHVDGPIFRPHTFWFRHSGGDLAKITKRWSGLSREAFSVADNFEVEFSDPSTPESMRWLILGAAFAIDLDFFEKKG